MDESTPPSEAKPREQWEPHGDDRAPHGLAAGQRIAGRGRDLDVFFSFLYKSCKTSCRRCPVGPVCGRINKMITHTKRTGASASTIPLPGVHSESEIEAVSARGS